MYGPLAGKTGQVTLLRWVTNFSFKSVCRSTDIDADVDIDIDISLLAAEWIIQPKSENKPSVLSVATKIRFTKTARLYARRYVRQNQFEGFVTVATLQNWLVYWLCMCVIIM